MPNTNCANRDCGRRIPSNKSKYTLHIPTLWPLYKSFVGDSWEESDREKHICQACRLKIRSQLKDPISKTFKRTKEQPVVDESLILENRTRSKRSREENLEDEQQQSTDSGPLPDSVPTDQ